MRIPCRGAGIATVLGRACLHTISHLARCHRKFRLGRSPRFEWSSRLHYRRPARYLGPRGTGPRACRLFVQRPELASQESDDQPGALGRPEGRRRTRPANRRGPAFGDRPAQPQWNGRPGLLWPSGLNGSLRHVPGMVALADATAPLGLVVPLCDVREASLVRGPDVYGAATLTELVGVLRGQADWPEAPAPLQTASVPEMPDLTDVRGQSVGRRVLEVAAAGRHHLLMIGPPGSGKTMLAERLPGLLPSLTTEEALTVSPIHSAAGSALPEGVLFKRPPFRAPHHQASIVSLIGGGSWSLRPGEVESRHQWDPLSRRTG